MEKLTKALMTDETGQAIVTKLTALSGQMHELAMATRGSAILFESESDISVLGDGGYLAVYVGSTNPLEISGWTGDNSLVTGHLYYLIKSGTAVTSRDLGEYGGTAVTDTTLSISGSAADAKAVGDALADKADADDVTALETTVAGKADSSDVTALGTRVTAVEGDIDSIKVEVSHKLIKLQDILTVPSKYISPSDGKLVTTSNYNCSDYIAVKTGDIIKGGASGTTTVALIAFYTSASTAGYVDSVVGMGTAYLKEYSYSVEQDGYIRVCNRIDQLNGYIYFDSNIPDGIEKTLERYDYDDSISVLSNAVKSVVAPVTGGILDVADLFEIGSISIASSGWTYSDSTKRIRTKENTVIPLEAGDIISFSDYSNIRYYVGYRTSAGTYGTSGAWLQEDYIVRRRGDYVINASNVPEVAITSPDEIAQYFQVKRCYNLENFMKLKNPCVIGVNHRGFNEVAPENTLPAFKLSIEKGFAWVETDISFTSDNVPVLLHDDTIDRTSDGTGSISGMTYEQVLEYDFGSWKSAEYAGTKIGTLEELLQLCKRTGLRAYLELKTNGSSQANVESCAMMVKKYGLADDMVWISFSVVSLRYIKNVLPNARLGLIASTMTDELIDLASGLKTGTNSVFIGSERAQFTEENVGKLITADIGANTYTIDNLTNILSDVNPYITSITTNSVNVEYAVLSAMMQ